MRESKLKHLRETKLLIIIITQRYSLLLQLETDFRGVSERPLELLNPPKHVVPHLGVLKLILE